MAWVMGWGIPEAWFAKRAREVFPAAEHCYVSPNEGWRRALDNCGETQWTIGYSLGAQLMLRSIDSIAGSIALLAPFISFPSEAHQGGRVARTQVRHLDRWIKRDRNGALNDFYSRAGLPGLHAEELSTSTEDLAWGLKQLSEECKLLVDVHERTGPVILIGGERDALLDTQEVAGHLSGLDIVSGAGHDPLPLMRAFAARIG